MDHERDDDQELTGPEPGSPVTPGPPSGRVRIIGAEPASPAAAPGEDAAPGPESLEDVWSSDAWPEEPAAPVLDGGPDAPAAELPHWTEAPTGEVPAVLARDPEHQDALSSVPAPTWREGDADWEAHDETFDAGMLAGHEEPISGRHDALDEERQPWSFDLDDEPDDPFGGALDDRRDDETMVVPAVSASGPSSERPVVAVPGDPGDDAGEAGPADESVPEAASAQGAATRRPLGRRDQPDAVPEVPVLLGDLDGAATALEGDDPVVAGTTGIAPPPGRTRGRRAARPVPQAPPPAAGAAAASLSRPVPQAPPGVPGGRNRGSLRPPDAPREEVPAPRSGRNVPVAVIAGLALGGLALVAFDLGTVLTMVVATVVVFLCAVEAFHGFRRAGYQPAVLLGWVAVVSLMISTYNKGQVALPLILVLTVVLTLIWYLAGVEPGADPLRGTATTVFVFCWIGVFGSFAALLLNPTLFPERHGIAFLFGAVIVTVACDVVAFFVGRAFGRHPLSPISPNKTWEGAIAGGIAAVLAGAIVVRFLHPFTPGSAVVLGLVAAVVTPLGDLCESLVKRQLGLKDMGRILPGHGGLLDRVDGLLFMLPATFYLVKAFHLG